MGPPPAVYSEAHPLARTAAVHYPALVNTERTTGTLSVKRSAAKSNPAPTPSGRPKAKMETRMIDCGHCLHRPRALPDTCIELMYNDGMPVR